MGLPFLLLSMALVILRKLGHNWNLPFEYILLLPATLTMCILGHLLNRLLTWMKCGQILTFFGKNSLELYLWHEFIYWNIDEHFFFKDLSMPIKFVLAVTVSLLFAYLTHLAIKHLMKRRLLRQ